MTSLLPIGHQLRAMDSVQLEPPSGKIALALSLIAEVGAELSALPQQSVHTIYSLQLGDSPLDQLIGQLRGRLLDERPASPNHLIAKTLLGCDTAELVDMPMFSVNDSRAEAMARSAIILAKEGRYKEALQLCAKDFTAQTKLSSHLPPQQREALYTELCGRCNYAYSFAQLASEQVTVNKASALETLAQLEALPAPTLEPYPEGLSEAQAIVKEANAQLGTLQPQSDLKVICARAIVAHAERHREQVDATFTHFFSKEKALRAIAIAFAHQGDHQKSITLFNQAEAARARALEMGTLIEAYYTDSIAIFENYVKSSRIKRQQGLIDFAQAVPQEVGIEYVREIEDMQIRTLALATLGFSLSKLRTGHLDNNALIKLATIFADQGKFADARAILPKTFGALKKEAAALLVKLGEFETAMKIDREQTYLTRAFQLLDAAKD